ncbi:tRNA 2-thiolation 2-A-like [Octopus vulgaris]|uniref:Cytoplasmic tRNA 2-thiolation protein 2 n=1 Tax=Octopus vulgaris TaxID=6645 RepID=A0AA36FHN0_OCTVU|nr:tRNA 2-thiolation 2-A-like [Octopus vulgaris]
MCSRQGEDENLDEPIRKLKLQNDGSVRLCVKCQENEAKFVIRQNDPFCRDCFLTHVTHKFRSNIGKSKLIRDRDCILLAYSGGPSSSALLHLVKDGLELSKFKKLRFIPEIVYIDEGAALGQSWAQRQEILIQIKEFCERMGMPYYITSLEQVFCPPENSKIKLKLYKNGQGELLQDTELEEKLVNLIRNTKSSTFKEQLIRHLRNDLLDRIARLTGNKMIMVGTGENRLAILMLADIAQGRGAHISLNVGFSDDRNDDILTVRPLKNLTSKEVAMYNNTNNITPVVCYSLTTMGWLDTAVLEASALNALHLSYNLSNGIQEQQVNGEGNCNSNDVGISDHLCFGCRAMAREMNEPDLLPIQMTQPNISLLQKDYIKDFLLEPSNENILNTGDS